MYQKEKVIIIFGASSGGTKVAQAFASMNIEVQYFVDNNWKKWGKTLEGKEIHSPESLRTEKQEYQIIIASEYQKAIEDQLASMDLLQHLILKEEVIMDYVKEHLYEFQKYIKYNQSSQCKNQTNTISGNVLERNTVIFDLLDGFELGGIENWSYMAASGLQKRHYMIQLYSNITPKGPIEELKNCVKSFDTDFNRYWELIHELVESIIQQLPCKLIINKQRQLLIAGSIVKRLFPEQIKIISILHNDRIDIYRRQAYMDCEVDKIACVSNDIQEHMIQEFGIDSKKIFYKESPVDYEEDFVKKYTVEDSHPIQIGYAARLEKVQKRVDLFLPLIQILEKRRVNYQLHIAGTGSYENKLKEFIKENSLEKKIIMYGYLAKEEMKDFWKQADIFINLSDYEGVGLSMLESMSYGCVPIVTQVAGSTEFITEDQNGYLCKTGDMEQMAADIIKLEKDRWKLQKFGDICKAIIKTRCSEKDYIDYLEKLLGD